MTVGRAPFDMTGTGDGPSGTVVVPERGIPWLPFRLKLHLQKQSSNSWRQDRLGPLIDLQEASFRRRQVTVIHVNVERGAAAVELGRVRAAIEALGNVTAATANEVLKNDRNLAILDAVSLAISIIAVAMGALSVLSALVMATQERTREIGIFAAIGWSNARIMASIVIEGMLMCAVGCGLGVLLSFLAAFAFPHIPAIGNLISFKPSVALIAPILGAAFALCLAGSLLPELTGNQSQDVQLPQVAELRDAGRRIGHEITEYGRTAGVLGADENDASRPKRVLAVAQQ